MTNLDFDIDRLLDGPTCSTVEQVMEVESKVVSINRDKPTHKLLALLIVNGHSVEEIAESVRLTVEQVRGLMGQPAVQRLIVEQLRQTGQTGVEDMLCGMVAESLVSLHNLIINAKTEPVKLNAIKLVLDRVLGPTGEALGVQKKKRVDERWALLEKRKMELQEQLNKDNQQEDFTDE